MIKLNCKNGSELKQTTNVYGVVIGFLLNKQERLLEAQMLDFEKGDT